jgi:hypothetical protein
MANTQFADLIATGKVIIYMDDILVLPQGTISMNIMNWYINGSWKG